MGVMQVKKVIHPSMTNFFPHARTGLINICIYISRTCVLDDKTLAQLETRMHCII